MIDMTPDDLQSHQQSLREVWSVKCLDRMLFKKPTDPDFEEIATGKIRQPYCDRQALCVADLYSILRVESA